MNLDSSAENRGTWCRWTNGHLQRTKNQNADRPCHAAWGNGTLQDPGAQYCFKRAGESPEVKYIQLSSPFSTSPTQASAFSERQFRSHENSEIPMWFPWDCKCSRFTQHMAASNGSVQWFPRNSNPHGSRPVTVQPISTLLSYPVIPSHTQSIWPGKGIELEPADELNKHRPEYQRIAPQPCISGLVTLAQQSLASSSIFEARHSICIGSLRPWSFASLEWMGMNILAMFSSNFSKTAK